MFRDKRFEPLNRTNSNVVPGRLEPAAQRDEGLHIATRTQRTQEDVHDLLPQPEQGKLTAERCDGSPTTRCSTTRNMAMTGGLPFRLPFARGYPVDHAGAQIRQVQLARFVLPKRTDADVALEHLGQHPRTALVLG